MLIGSAAGDDAGVYRLDAERALVQTVDFFTPIVDDGYTYGRIAATNALSDVYAMGGRPLTALNILGYPPEKVPEAVVVAILRGGADVVRAARCATVGGHTIRNPEPLFGLAVTGLVHPAALLTKATARVGDRLVLTKPLGTGIITTALQRGRAAAQPVERAVDTMTRLNSAGPEVAAAGVTAATDITGFGLTGHLADLCAASRCGAELWFDRVPLIDPSLPVLIGAGCVPGGSSANLAAADDVVDWGSCPETTRQILADAQTSGGLLLCVAAELLATVSAVLVRHGALATVIGRITPAASPPLAVRAAP